jgi:hypothetical protein
VAVRAARKLADADVVGENRSMEAGLQRVRDRVLDELGTHFAQGHLHPPTLEQRVADVLGARTKHDVTAATWDLPALRDPLFHRMSRRLPRAHGGRCRRLYLFDLDMTCLDLTDEPRSWVIGRSRSCDVVVSAEDVSRRHAVVSVRGGRCSIRDLGSLHGVYVDERPVEVATLLPGASLRLGESLVGVVR